MVSRSRFLPLDPVMAGRQRARSLEQALRDRANANRQDAKRYPADSVEANRCHVLAMAYERDADKLAQGELDLSDPHDHGVRMLRVQARFYRDQDEEWAREDLLRIGATNHNPNGFILGWIMECSARAHQLDAAAGRPARWEPSVEAFEQARKELADEIERRLTPTAAAAE